MVVAQEKARWQEPLEQEQEQELRRGKAPLRPAKKSSRFAKGKSMLLLALIVGLTAAMAAVTIQLTVVQGAEVRKLEKEIAELKINKNLLQMEADKLRAVNRIESEALAMGMERPAGTVYVASSLPSLSDQKAAPPVQEETQVEVIADKFAVLKKYSQMFTSFFASTQR